MQKLNECEKEKETRVQRGRIDQWPDSMFPLGTHASLDPLACNQQTRRTNPAQHTMRQQTHSRSIFLLDQFFEIAHPFPGGGRVRLLGSDKGKRRVTRHDRPERRSVRRPRSHHLYRILKTQRGEKRGGWFVCCEAARLAPPGTCQTPFEFNSQAAIGGPSRAQNPRPENGT